MTVLAYSSTFPSAYDTVFVAGLLKSDHKVTAGGLLRLNDAFDVLNSRRLDQNPNRQPFSTVTEGSHTRVLTELRNWLRLRSVNGCAPPADSIQGLQLTISAVLFLWQTASAELKSSCTRRLTQEGLENFFGMVRQVNRGKYKPVPANLGVPSGKLRYRMYFCPRST